MKKKYLNTFLFIACGLTNVFCKNTKPNIVFILADDLGNRDLGYQGSDISTPNIDELTGEGIILDRCYSQPQSTPSRFALMTGMYPYRYGFHEHIVADFSSHGIPNELELLPENLKNEGYNTAIFGKWHLGLRCQSYSPNYNGFDYFLGANGGTVSYWNYSATGQVDFSRNGKKLYPGSLDENEQSGNEYFTDLLTTEAIQYVNSLQKKQPFFLFMAYTTPHSPFQAPQELVDKYKDYVVDKKNLSKNNSNPSLLRHTYMAMVENMDINIGRLVDMLKKEGLYENTIIIFCSDNGGVPIVGDNGRLSGFKGSSLEGGVRVPAFVVWPSVIKKGTRSSELLHFTDWYPTLIEAVSGKLNLKYELDGVSAMPILKGGKSKREYIPIVSSNDHALITPEWSLVMKTDCNYSSLFKGNAEDNSKLYNLRNDISQTNDISENNERIKKELTDKLLGHISESISGQFNWDINVARFYLPHRIGDHYCDWRINDMPNVKVITSKGKKNIEVSPVNKYLSYELLASKDNINWDSKKIYKSENDADHYVFIDEGDYASYKYFRIKPELHFGIPGCESFEIDDNRDSYIEGTISPTQGHFKKVGTGTYKAGFVPCSDMSNGVNIFIRKGNIDGDEHGVTSSDGYLQMNANALFGRYFAKVHCNGTYYVSMELKLNKQEAGDKITAVMSRNIGGMGTIKDFPFLKFSIENNTVYIEINDKKCKLKDYNQEKLKLVLGFNLNVINKDKVFVFINPKMKTDQLPKADYIAEGEFTFDKLTLSNDSKNNNYVPLKIDNICVAYNWNDCVKLNSKK